MEVDMPCLGHKSTRDLLIMSRHWWRFTVTQQSVREICVKQGDGVHIAHNLTHCYRQVSLPCACKHFREQMHVMLSWPRSGARLEMLAICKWCRFALPQGFPAYESSTTSLALIFQLFCMALQLGCLPGGKSTYKVICRSITGNDIWGKPHVCTETHGELQKWVLPMTS